MYKWVKSMEESLEISLGWSGWVCRTHLDPLQIEVKGAAAW